MGELMLGILGGICVFFAAILIHEFGHMMAARLFGVGVVEYSVGMGPALFSHRWKDTVYSFRLIPFGGYCSLYGEELDEEELPAPLYKTDWKKTQMFSAKPWWQRLIIYAAGPFMNVVLAGFLCILLVLFFDVVTLPKIVDLPASYPAASSGLQVGDVICGLDDRDVFTFLDYSEYRSSHKDMDQTGYRISVLRDGQKFSYWAQPDENGVFGVSVQSVLPDTELSVPDVCFYSVNMLRYMKNMVVDSFYMLTHGMAHVQDMSGAVGVTATVASSVEQTVHTDPKDALRVLVFMTAFLCINLSILNMIPFPALDGGHVFLCLIEGIFRRRVPSRIETAINLVGVGMLFLLLGVTLVNDVVKLFTGGFF